MRLRGPTKMACRKAARDQEAAISAGVNTLPRLMVRETTHSSCRRANKQTADPFTHAKFKRRQFVERWNRHPKIPFIAKCPIGDRIRDDRKARAAEDADRTRHMPRRGYEQPGLARLRLNEIACEHGVFESIAGLRLEHHALGGHAEGKPKLSRANCFRRPLLRKTSGAARVDEPRIGIASRQFDTACHSGCIGVKPDLPT